MDSLFYQLIRVSLGTQESLSRTPTEREWSLLYKMAQKQSLLGICFAGVQKVASPQPSSEGKGESKSSPLGEDLGRTSIPELLYLRWLGTATKIQQRNHEMDIYTQKALDYFREKGYPCQVLKGQGIAKLYGNLRDLRQSGDIDIWMAGGKKRAFELSVADFGEVTGLTYYHIHYPLALNPSANVGKGAEVELHFWPSFLASPIRNRALREFSKFYEPRLNEDEGRMTKDEERKTNDESPDTPSLAFNRIYILLHCYRHLCGHGVGLRQFLDYYFVLRASYEERKTKDDSLFWIERLGMKKFARATMWVMKEVFGLDDRYLLCEPDASAGRFLLNEIMHSGNMGHSEDRFNGRISSHAMARYWYNLKRDIRLIQLCPHEALWDPVFNVYQFIWCKIQKMNDKGRKTKNERQ